MYNFVEACNARAELEIPNFRNRVENRNPSIFDEEFLRTRTDFPRFGYIMCENSDVDPFFMLDNNDDAVAKHWYWYGRDGYEPASTREWTRRAKRAEVVFDLGSHTGAFTLLAARANANLKQLCAFEPTARAYSRLVENLIVNALLGKVRPERIAASNIAGPLQFNVFDDLYQIGTGNSYKTEHTSFAVRSHETCQATTIDTYIRETDFFPDLMKIDVEGAEVDVLAGAAELIDQRRTMFLIEVTPASLKDVAKVFERYRICLIDDDAGDVVPYTGQDISDFTNLIVDPV